MNFLNNMTTEKIEKNIKSLPSDFFDDTNIKQDNSMNCAIVSADLAKMHEKFDVYPVVKKMNKEQLRNYLKFRFDMMREELDEAELAMSNKDPEEIVDGIIDLSVFALGTLDVFDVNIDTAWNVVHDANMAKTAGVKSERPNPFGFPDLTKPQGWTAPCHEGNHGLLARIFNED